MKINLRAIRNSFLLIVGLGIIGFSTYRAVRDFDQTEIDLIGGEEIVVISENTPVVSSIISNNDANNQNIITGSPTELDSQSSLPDNSATVTDSPDGVSKTDTDNPVQDTFLAQIEKRPSVEKSQVVIPDRIVIPTIQLNAPVIVAGSRTVKVIDQTFDQWVAPNQFAAGWHGSSAYLGQNGNTVINGHHNEYGKVFGNLINLNPGETIYLYSGTKIYPYLISNKMILKEKNEELQVRMENSSWIQPSKDERLTLITCWPPESNTHRLIIVAVPYIASPERVIG